jgi:hypothetical protein
MVDDLKFEETYLKIKLEKGPQLLRAESDPRIPNLLSKINEISNDKMNEKCGNLIERLNLLTNGNKIELDDNYNLKINPKEGKEDEYFKTESNLKKCLQNFNIVHYENLSKLNYLVNFRNKANDKCLVKCRSLDDPADCIKDCFNFNIINTKATNDLLFDEFMKYYNSVNKL